MTKRALLLPIFVLLCTLGHYAPRAQQGKTTYIYDDKGRLHAVVAPTGEAAIYEYDAAGNITSISRRIYTTVSILSFTPTSGKDGTTVNIHGTGFSLNPAENAVSFDGAAAQILSNTATEIVTRVPDGATTGPLTVTTPTGTATSRTPFVVSPPPTITEFAPQIGAPGDAVTITGTDFAAEAANNLVKIGNTPAPVSTASATELVASVPAGAVSGRISVTTSSGTATTEADFFVPPAPIRRLGRGQRRPAGVRAEQTGQSRRVRAHRDGRLRRRRGAAHEPDG